MSTKKSTAPRRRVRRSAEDARAHILEVARRRLAALGIGGLNIADVAREAGISHGTLLHHFGSSEGMRQALAARMAEGLLEQVLEIESGADPTEGMGDFFVRLFAQLSTGGHGRLLAWLALTGDGDARGGDVVAEVAGHFDQLVLLLAERLRRAGHPADAERTARYLVLLVVSSAVGLGVSRESLLPGLALSDRDEADYARWLARVIGERLKPGPKPL